MKKILKIGGMGCEHCIKSVREALQEIEGLEILEVKIGEATVEIKNEELIEVIKERLDDAGYDLIQKGKGMEKDTKKLDVGGKMK